MSFLVGQPSIDRTIRNRDGETAMDVVCRRAKERTSGLAQRTRHRRCLCLGGMLCIHACLTKYAELKYTSSNESLLLLVEHDLELII